MADLVLPLGLGAPGLGGGGNWPERITDFMWVLVPLSSRGGGNSGRFWSPTMSVLVPLSLRGGGNQYLLMVARVWVLVPLRSRGDRSTCGHGADAGPGIHT